ncbi:GH92 family glycosyl hydrolase [Bowmanella denitrificans]|uniref:GH92 family glycosyl hydrolase n=1 Tax=Bowmanella denitrificans TaxID=366582 RepID=UPI000C9B0738|nr:GH92 family glycosyl hydrolase [Bowmanella denitrificans]
MDTKLAIKCLGLSVLICCLNLPVLASSYNGNSQYVDPFIGTGGEGHTFPGAVVPFGMMQLSPDTEAVARGIDPQPEIYKRCAGYHYDDTTMLGFSHTHFSGTGHSDLGDLLIQPMVGVAQTTPGTVNNPESGYRSRFSHEREWAEPGYYAVDLLDYDIHAELSTTVRAGIHRYTFSRGETGHVLLDLTHSIYNFSNKVIWSDARVVDKQTLLLHRRTNGWAKNRPTYFAVQFSRPFDDIELINEDNTRYRCNGCLDHGGNKPSTIVNPAEQYTAGKAIKVMAHFSKPTDKPLLIKVGMSAVSHANALENLQAEIPHWNFDQVRSEARSAWDHELAGIDMQGELKEKRQFYTAMYHALQAPSVYQDVNGQYLGVDGAIHKAEGFTNYTLFSLWDTYRALHPLLTYVDPERVNDMITSMLVHYQQSPNKILPIWSFQGHETWTMIGYHAVSVIADAYLKGIRDFDVELAKEAILATANHARYDAIPEYKQYGYVPMNVLPESVSITLEYAYDDFTIARFFDAQGDKTNAAEFYRRSQFYRNVFDQRVNFMRGLDSKGNWDPEFDPEAAKYMGPFTEGNSYQYTFYVPHDVQGLIDLFGGDKPFVERLDTLFSKELSYEKIKEHEDIAGLIGQYAHGNEPSHHIAYLYNYAGEPWRTQQRIRQIMDTLSSDKPDGLAGNDDVGQMSAWYLFSAIGFYPVAPGDLIYVIGAPQVPQAAFRLANGKTFAMTTEGLSKDNLYIQSATLNGKVLERSYLTHADIMQGGKLHFVMGSVPNSTWGKDASQRPPGVKAQF